VILIARERDIILVAVGRGRGGLISMCQNTAVTVITINGPLQQL